MYIPLPWCSPLSVYLNSFPFWKISSNSGYRFLVFGLRSNKILINPDSSTPLSLPSHSRWSLDHGNTWQKTVLKMEIIREVTLTWNAVIPILHPVQIAVIFFDINRARHFKCYNLISCACETMTPAWGIGKVDFGEFVAAWWACRIW